MSPGTDIFTGDSGNGHDPLSIEVALIADTHAHYLWGSPTFLQTNTADRVSDSAIRTPQGDLWSPFAQLWMLDHLPKGEPIIHAGDVADIACVQEFDAFVQMMNSRQDRTGPWYLSPGNHDAYFYGNYQDEVDCFGRTVDVRGSPIPKGDWTRACSGTENELTKERLVAKYLAALRDQPTSGVKPIAARLEAREARIDDIRGEGAARLSAIAWMRSPDAPWTSYVVQQLDLTMPQAPNRPDPTKNASPVVAILLDTSAYDQPPIPDLPIGSAKTRLAGLTGDLPAAEQAIVEDWARAAVQKKASLVLVGHHPSGALTARGQAFLQKLHQRYGAILYVSAHDHLGKWGTIGGDKDSWIELNLGAMIDVPVEMRHLVLIAQDDGRRAIRSNRVRLEDLMLSNVNCGSTHLVARDGWEAKPDEADYYLSYKDRRQGVLFGIAHDLFGGIQKTQDTILNVLLSNWQRYLRNVRSTPDAGPWPDDLGKDDDQVTALIQRTERSGSVADKVHLLQQLGQFAPKRPVVDQDHIPKSPDKHRRDFRICQAYWGFNYEKILNRLPNVDDWTIVLPRE